MSCLRMVKVRRAVAAAEAEDAAASRMAKTALRNRIPAKNKKRAKPHGFALFQSVNKVRFRDADAAARQRA